MITALRVLILVSVSVLAGCIFFASPDDNQPFSDIRSIYSLEGTYRNHGETARWGSENVYLSAFLWPEWKQLHDDISLVQVTALDDSTFQVTGWTNYQIVKESVFVEGKDFEIANGRIKIRRRAAVSGFKSGEVILGPYYESLELGLDTKGHGKSRSTGAVVGFAFLFIPFAAGGTEDFRFVRVETP